MTGSLNRATVFRQKIEEGLEHSRVLVLCMSTNAFGSDWPQLESGMFRFRDPLNKERRFIPLKLDGPTVKGSLAQFVYIDWRVEARDREYQKLLESCLAAENRVAPKEQAARGRLEEKDSIPRSHGLGPLGRL